jgi:hypothetical protein
MNLAIFIVAVAALALGVILFLAIKQRLGGKRAPGFVATIHTIDVEAFRNLINPAEDEYLRRRLSPAACRTVRLARLRAMAAYVQVAGSNAAVLMRVGEAALAGGDPRLAEAAGQLVNDAILLRRNTTLALVRIYVAMVWPSSEFAALRVVDRYERLSGSAMLLGRLQNPSASVRLSLLS